MSALGKCQKCGKEILLPSVDGIEQAANVLDKNIDGSRGTALAYLWMVAACMRGFCVLCSPERTPALIGKTRYQPEQETHS